MEEEEKKDEKWKDWSNSGQGAEWKDAFYSFTGTDDKAAEHVKDVDTSRSWKDLEWDKNREDAARLVVGQETHQLSQEERNLYEQNSSTFWDEFYDKHNNKFFKPRNYLPSEFPEVVLTPDLVSNQDQKIVVELGCGNGSSFYPLIEMYKELEPRPLVYGIDFSSTAIEHIKGKEGYNSQFGKALTCDLVSGTLPLVIKENKIDIALLIFVLSAIEPANMGGVLKKIFAALKPGGLLVFRDYGLYDMTQMRFVKKKRRKIEESFYVRADGTRTYFFALDVFERLALQAGFTIEKLKYDIRELKNRKRKLTMYRVWLSAKLRKPQ